MTPETTSPALEDLRSRYDALVAIRSMGVPKAEIVTAAREFLEVAPAYGRFIARPEQRRTAQDMLDYWFTYLLANSDDSMDTLTPRLSEYDATADWEAPDALGIAEPDAPLSLEYSREIIRLGGLARQWKRQNRESGYLLKGDALRDARQYVGDDPDIADLVAASDDLVRQAKNRWIAGLVIISCFSIGLAVIAAVQSYLAKIERENAEAAHDAAVAKAESLSAKQAELEKQLRVLDSTIDIIRQQVRDGKIEYRVLPSEIASRVDPREPKIHIWSSPELLKGYDPAFTGALIALPTLSPENRRTAFADGRPIDYVNYSLVLDVERRLPFFTAANIDRQSLRAIPQSPQQDYLLDPRVGNADAQVAQRWHDRINFVRGYLVNGVEIAWGPAFSADDATSGEVRDQIVNVATNGVPQFKTFNQGVWAALETWSRTQHNPLADQVTIFSGPILGEDDPSIRSDDGVSIAVPRAYWKIIVSRVPSYSQRGAEPAFVVDAFLLSQFQPGTQESVGLEQNFDPERYRVPVAMLEELTGLRFSDIIRDFDRATTRIASTGDLLSGRVKVLDAPDATSRKAVAQELVSVLRDGGLPWPEQKKVLTALVDMAQEPTLLNATATGRLNLLFVLSEVPADMWTEPDAVDLKAQTRAAVAALERRARSGQTAIGPNTQKHLARLETNVGYGEKSSQTVYLQFSTIPRHEASAMNAALVQLGWQIPGIEEVNASSVNEIRYNPESVGGKESAQLLAADIRATGKQVSAVSNGLIKNGVLEVWVSR